MSFLDRWAAERAFVQHSGKWTQHEIGVLGQGLADGLTDQQLATKLGRSRRAVSAQRLKSFGLRRLLGAPSKEWTPERVEELKRLAAEGLRNGDIALKMGISRNAVIGKRDRLKLPKLGPGINFTSKCLPHKPRKDGRPGPGIQTVQKAKVIPIGVAEPLRIGFMDLGPNHCRWVLDEQRDGLAVYCGHEKLGEHSYCPGHWRMSIDRRPRGNRFSFRRTG